MELTQHNTCRFATNTELMAAPESRPVVLLYNRVAKTLVEYEVLWTASWLRNIHAAHTGLDRTLMRRDPEIGMQSYLGLLASIMM